MRLTLTGRFVTTVVGPVAAEPKIAVWLGLLARLVLGPGGVKLQLVWSFQSPTSFWFQVNTVAGKPVEFNTSSVNPARMLSVVV